VTAPQQTRATEVRAHVALTNQREAGLDVAVGRLLRAGVVTAVALMAVGVALMAIHGIEPNTHPFPPFNLSRIPSDIAALKPEGYLWLGLIAVILTPISRVVASMIGYARAADRTMVLISIAVLFVIALSVTVAIVTS
jgi:uncharacterized membrane protein